MKELEKIYEKWSEDQTDRREVVGCWCEIEVYLYEVCSDNAREKIEDYILSYGRLLEEQAFIEGFGLAFRIWKEVIDGGNDKKQGNK